MFRDRLPMAGQTHQKPKTYPETSTIRSELYALAALVVAGVCLLGIYRYMSLRQNLLAPAWLYLLLYAFAYGGYLYAALRVAPRMGSQSRLVIPLIVGLGFLFRLMLVPTPPSISTDIYRYVWDGRLICHGINPYRWAPFDPRLSSFRDATIWEPMEYKAYQTVYMPVSQAFFGLGYLLFHASLIGFKLMYVVLDGAVMLALVYLLRRLSMPATNIIWYAWCPLPITEVGVAGHQDVAGVLLMLAAFALMTHERWRKCAVFLVAAALTKGFPFLLLPLFTRRFGWRFAVIAAIAMVYLGLPLWVYLPDFLHGMRQYLGTVHVNSGLFNAVNVLLGFMMRRYHYILTSWLSDLAMLAAVLWSAWTKPKSDQDTVRRAIVVLATCLLVVPTLFPWYLLWVLPLVTIYKPKPSTAFIALSGTVVLLYTYYIAKMPYWWTPILEYAPFYALLWWEWRKGYWREPDASPAEAPPSPSRFDDPSRGARLPLDTAGAAAD